MQSTWVETPATPTDLDPAVVLEHLRTHGVLFEVERLMAEDAAGIERPSVDAPRLRALLNAACA